MTTRQVFVAFPGIGKTTYARNRSGVVDLDFGYYRESLGVDPKRNSYLYPQFCRLANYYLADGFIVLTNEPGLIPIFKQSAQVTMVVPKHPDVIYQRIAARGSESRKFAQAMQEHATEWVTDWRRIAAMYKIPVVEVDYFSEVKL